MIFYYNSSQTGAPELSGTAGSLKTLLQTCLVTGFGAGSATGITVASGVATVSFSGAHPYIVDGPIAVAGATPAALNGNKTVTAITTNSVKFAAPGVPDGAATGTITTKVPGAGWQELYPGTANIVALAPTVPQAVGCALRCDDIGTRNARVTGYEAMTDISTGVGRIPLDTQVSGGLWWPKSSTASSTARSWTLVADERALLLFVAPSGNGNHTALFAGDINSLRSGDAWAWLVTGHESDMTSSGSLHIGCNGYSARAARGGAFMARSYTGLGGATPAQRVGVNHNGTIDNNYSGMPNYSFGAYPNGANNGLLLAKVEVNGTSKRGTLPGLYHATQDCAANFAHGLVIDGTDDMAGRRLLALRVGQTTGSSFGTAFVDVTGPWR